MSRGLVLLTVVAAAASAQAALSACTSAVFDANGNVVKTTWYACKPQYEADVQKFNKNPNCSGLPSPSYDVATCDPIIANYMACGLIAATLLKADNTFDDAAFKASALQNKCSADAKFIAAYPTCKNSTMKYFNYNRLFTCLMKAVYTDTG
ncbi:uncharacterized protein LOC108676540 [Hyalella azteca]|uniref:Uncharacterized protein LOC108676540 n=1 Tax=Hyalella azteca TaxID=294128 RepID=A0A8B7P2C4_HYAAZ|nr:uncharacterized protein LOC108676540 [Hyalella azteca]